MFRLEKVFINSTIPLKAKPIFYTLIILHYNKSIYAIVLSVYITMIHAIVLWMLAIKFCQVLYIAIRIYF
ncbi:hypothetical protein DXA32_20075 [Subdoligranulum sp. OF01-18]|nr:hypothetical protein DXA32_20075 [Subdoligranulum sp. OF01-18]